MSLDQGNTKAIVLLSLFSSIIYVSQIVLSFIPNVNIVTLLFVVYTFNLGIKKTFVVLVVFNTLMGITYGFGYWIIGYFWIYGTLIILTRILMTVIKDNVVLWSLFGLIFGFLFGFLFAINDYYFVGVSLKAYYLKGIPYDIIHGFSNMLALLFLFNPLNNVIKRGVNKERIFT